MAAEAETSQPLKKESYPAWSILTYHFAAKGNRPALKLVWYDGGKLPPRPPRRSRIAIGRQRHLLPRREGHHPLRRLGGTPRLVPESRMRNFQRPAKTIPRSIGHVPEWIRACKEGKPEDAKAGFAYSGPVYRGGAGGQSGLPPAKAH